MSSSNELPLSVSVIVPIRNELERLPQVIRDIERQSLLPRQVFFIDGVSEDGSREWLLNAARSREWMTVLDNPARIIPTALNRALEMADSDILARMDAHVDYPASYLSALVEVLQGNRSIVGAGAPYTVKGHGHWGEAIAAVLRRPWGNGAPTHQTGKTLGPAAHVRWCAYRTEALRAAGGWDAMMLVNEDEEMDIRLRKSFGDLWLVPSIQSTWYARGSLRSLAQQMWRYGYYRAVTLRKHPDSANPRILAPPSLVMFIAISLLARSTRARLLAGLYAATACSLGAYSASCDEASWWRGALTLPTIHLVYGTGFWAGLRSGQ